MSAESLSAKYIAAMEKSVAGMSRTRGPIFVSEKCIDELLSYVTDYLKDAKYFRERKEFATSLTSIAYCEGLLDALKLIGAVDLRLST